MKSFYPKKDQIERKWVLIDLKDKAVGRAATEIATILRGKNKPTYTPGVDMGDFVVAINSDQIKFTGAKWQDKKYYKHTGHMGGIKEITAEKLREKDSTQIIIKAVKGMLASGPMGRKQLKKLKVYSGADHPHTAQTPEVRA